MVAKPSELTPRFVEPLRQTTQAIPELAAALGDEAHALHVARRLRAGAVSINDAGLTAQVSDVGKDSFGASGVGRSRMGASGLLRFLRKQALLVQAGQPTSMDVFQERKSPD